VFDLSQFPQETQEWFHKEPVFWPSAVSAAVAGGVKDRNDLANIVFFMHHKERMSGNRGKALQAGEPRFEELAEEWKAFRTMVTPMVTGTGKAKPGLKSNHIKTVGAWCGTASLANPARDVDFAVEHRINRLDIVVNDFAKSRAPQQFTMRDTKKIQKLCELARKKGVEIHLMSWIMPHKAFIDRAAQLLVPVCNDVGAASLQWDAEEPWTQAKDRMQYSDAADRIADRFSGLTCRMGITARGFAEAPKVGPLVAICDYTLPQAYSTATSGVEPGAGQKRIYRHYEAKFGKPITMGLAAYSQEGIAKHTIESAMIACINQTNELRCD
jgi:hypothetical protein